LSLATPRSCQRQLKLGSFTCSRQKQLIGVPEAPSVERRDRAPLRGKWPPRPPSGSRNDQEVRRSACAMPTVSTDPLKIGSVHLADARHAPDQVPRARSWPGRAYTRPAPPPQPTCGSRHGPVRPGNPAPSAHAHLLTPERRVVPPWPRPTPVRRGSAPPIGRRPVPPHHRSYRGAAPESVADSPGRNVSAGPGTTGRRARSHRRRAGPTRAPRGAGVSRACGGARRRSSQ
jgi:hypothetical protein